MKKAFSTALFAVTLGLFAVNPASAISGACSYHGGVNCAAGSDYDGSVICYDGWRGSSVSYSSMVMCSPYQTPSCPLMSIYDSYSGSCKCMSGYVAGTDIFGKQSCVSADSQCRDQIGLMSQYNSLTGNCECMSGYILDKDFLGKQTCTYANSVCSKEIGTMSRYNSLTRLCECSYGYVIYNGQCTSQDGRCTDLYGYGARYNSLKASCECGSGYSFNGSRCEYSSDGGSSLYYPPSSASNLCPQYSTLNTDGKCYCDTGYSVSLDKSACVPIVCQQNSTLIGDSCVCDTGYQWNAGQTACVESVTNSNTPPTVNSGVDMVAYCKSLFGGAGSFDVVTGNCFNSVAKTPPAESAATPNPADDRLAGRILLQVESYGEAWYISPSDKRRYYMKDGASAYQMMRSFGLGINDSDLAAIPSESDSDSMKSSSSICSQNALANRLKGKILLQVEQNGEAWYVYPDTCRRIYLKDGASAYSVMRFLSLGISNADISKIDTGSLDR